MPPPQAVSAALLIASAISWRRLSRAEASEWVGVIGLPCESLRPDAADAGLGNN
jgi:hypothetical protein